jgi:hypothetical protein
VQEPRHVQVDVPHQLCPVSELVCEINRLFMATKHSIHDRQILVTVGDWGQAQHQQAVWHQFIPVIYEHDKETFFLEHEQEKNQCTYNTQLQSYFTLQQHPFKHNPSTTQLSIWGLCHQVGYGQETFTHVANQRLLTHQNCVSASCYSSIKDL